MNNREKKCTFLRVFVLLFFSFSFFPLYARFSFKGLDLNSDNYLIFKAKESGKNFKSDSECENLFLARLGKEGPEGEIKSLTCFPEKMEILENGKILQLRNRFGTAWFNEKTMSLEWKSNTSFHSSQYSFLPSYSVSPDGNYILYIEAKGKSYGNLVLLDVRSGDSRTVYENAERSIEELPVKWADDSKVFLYEKKGNVYFFTPQALFKNVEIPESYRKIGEGTINSVFWSSSSIIYIDKDIVYRIDENEIWTRGLYAGVSGKGQLHARLLSSFNSEKDRFWVSGDLSTLLIVSSSLIMKCTVDLNNFTFVNIDSVSSFSELKASPFNFKVYWKERNIPLIWTEFISYDDGKKSSAFFTLEEKIKPLLEIKDYHEPRLSPDGKFIAFSSTSKLFVYSLSSWNEIYCLEGERFFSYEWADSSRIFAGGEKTVRLLNLDPSSEKTSSSKKTKTFSPEEKVLLLSSVYDAFWNGGRIAAQSEENGKYYIYDSSRNCWKESSQNLRYSGEKNEKNSRYRVFISSVPNRLYENGIFVRPLSSSPKTYSLIKDCEKKLDEEKKIGLAVDFTDSQEGLNQILSCLEDFGIKATFFVNGEAIRCYPLEVLQIEKAGYECASSFCSATDLTSREFLADENFIVRGLARNEDDFFSLTGKEFLPLWHAPFNKASPAVKAAGEKAGYVYIESLSFENGEDFKDSESAFQDSALAIENFIKSLKDSSVISIECGKDDGLCLYEKFSLLCSSILESGYTITDVKELCGKEIF